MTSKPAGKPGGRHAPGLEASPDAGLPAEHAPERAAAQAGPHAESPVRPPDDVQELQQEIDQAREQLGETVEQLVAKTDVKTRTRDKATELAGRVKHNASQARAATAGAVSARQRWVPLTVAAGVLIMGYVAIRWRTRR